MATTIRVGVLFGGRSAEHEVSLISARSVVRALDRTRFEPVLIGIDKQGKFLLQDEATLLALGSKPKDILGAENAAEVTLAPVPRHGALQNTTGALSDKTVDVVFPVLHGTYGEDGTIQGLLELADLPYVGAGVLGSSVGMDKDVMKRLLAEANLPIAKWTTLRYAAYQKDTRLARIASDSLGYPCFVKPANAGSSVGVVKVKSAEEIDAAMQHAFQFDNKVLIEEGIDAREVEVAVLGNEYPKASIAGEIVVHHKDGFYSYDAKYLDESGSHAEIPANLSAEQQSMLQNLAVQVFQCLDCRGMARVDFFVDRKTGRIVVNEINTIPGFTSISMYPKLWEATGLSYQDLISTLIDLAFERHQAKQRCRFEK